MSGDNPRRVLTIDHANKQAESRDSQLYRYWLRQAKLLRDARGEDGPERFRRDQVTFRRS